MELCEKVCRAITFDCNCAATPDHRRRSPTASRSVSGACGRGGSQIRGASSAWGGVMADRLDRIFIHAQGHATVGAGDWGGEADSELAGHCRRYCAPDNHLKDGGVLPGSVSGGSGSEWDSAPMGASFGGTWLRRTGFTRRSHASGAASSQDSGTAHPVPGHRVLANGGWSVCWFTVWVGRCARGDSWQPHSQRRV